MNTFFIIFLTFSQFFVKTSSVLQMEIKSINKNCIYLNFQLIVF